MLWTRRRPSATEVDDRPGSSGEHSLQAQDGTTERADRFYNDQVADRLNENMREFVARMEMAFIATSDAKGNCDSTFRAGPPGFVRVLDDATIAWPEYRGNGVMASAGNISENGHVGVLFVDFVRDLIGLHINGAARLVDADEFGLMHANHVTPDEIPGRRPERWVVVDIHEAYIHCAKHIPRMQPVPRTRAWGTDDKRKKGGDYFGLAAERRACDT